MSRLIEDYLRNLFEEKKVPENQREQLWRYYYDKLSKGVDEGFSPQSSHYDKDLADALKLSIAEFSAFKETSFRKTIEDLLVDENGSLRSWSEFKKEAYKISGDYNHRWLETEYHQTIANAQIAEKWKGFEANADLFPNLKLVSVKDGRVRLEHQVLDGTIRPLNDPFWKTHTPPLDWGCRCDVIQTDEDPTEIKGGLQLKIEFENNPAISRKIFGGSAYMTSGGLNPEMIEKIGNWGKEMFKKSVKNGREIIEKSKLYAPYKTIYKAKNGAEVSVSPFADKKDLEDNIKTAKLLADKLKTNVKIRPHLSSDILMGNKNPEYEISGKIGDRKAVNTSKVKNLRNTYRSAKEQGCECIVFDLDNTTLTIEEVKQEAIKKFETFPSIKEVYIHKNGEIIKIKSNP